MVQIRLPHPSGDSKDEKQGIEPILLEHEKVYTPGAEKCGSVLTSVKDGASALVIPLVDESPVEANEVHERDPWDLPELQDNSPSWTELDKCGKIKRVVLCYVGKPVALLTLLYFFICSLDILSSAFRLLGGKAIGEVFASSTLLQNPVAGLMIGIISTVTVQSSSTSTSIVITMVASGIIPVPVAIPIIMGANIGTSVTNTIVAMTESGNRDNFRLAFAGATVHDMFNWLSVLVLLPLECATGGLYHFTTFLVKAGNFKSDKDANRDFLKKLTKPFTKMIVQLDKKIIEKIALGNHEYSDKSLIKRCDSYELHGKNGTLELLNESYDNSTFQINYSNGKCGWFILQSVPLSDMWLGLLLLVGSLIVLCSCLVLLVKVLKSVLKGNIMKIVKKVVNAQFIGAGYIGILVGAVMTMLVQSSSIFTSVLTPLVGMNVIKLENMYPLTLGSNIGTTGTGMLAAMAATGDKLEAALQIALVHLFFNIFGIILFFPIPQTRIPISLARIMGNTTAKYRWFAAFYLVMMFMLLPLLVFGISMAGFIPLAVFLCIVMSVSTLVIILNVLQRKIPERLPKKLRTWDFLPFEWMHSLEPLDRVVSAVVNSVRRCCPCCKSKKVKNTDAADKAEVEALTADRISYEQPTMDQNSLDQTKFTADLEKKLNENWDTESGYGSRDASTYPSRIPTPNNSLNTTPSASILPSRAASVLDIKESKL